MVRVAPSAVRVFMRHFARTLEYRRGVTSQDIQGFTRPLLPQERAALAGDYGQDVLFFQTTVAEMQRVGLHPPQDYDRVRIGSRNYTLTNTDDFNEAETAVFVKGWLKGS